MAPDWHHTVNSADTPSHDTDARLIGWGPAEDPMSHPDHQHWLEAFLTDAGAVSGTLHLQDAQGDLVLVAAHRIPPPVIAKVQHVPHGKGMAGLAQVQRQPVQTCNLKEDTTGRLKEPAKLVDARAAIAIPVLRDDAVYAVVGAAFAFEGELTAEQVGAMVAGADGVG